MLFRNDINGLRAIAVVSVIIFHFNNNWLPGGFVGVDVFFVISGYLMTSIIITGLNNNSFSLISFYKARARRIIPPLLAVSIALLVFGYLLLEPSTLMAAGKHIASSLSFISNEVYLRESGYFDSSSKEKFLLHTWSLSVEWQFYIIYPIILFISTQLIAKQRIKWVVLSIAFADFILSLYMTNHNTNMSYYSFSSRSWEMMIGGLVFLFPLKMKRSASNKMFYIGLTGIVASLCIVNDRMPWPGFAAALPVISSAILLISNNQKTILSLKPAQYIGNISYSIYLIHWVVIVACLKAYIPLSFFNYLLTTIILSHVLHALVEKKSTFNLRVLCVYLITISFALYVAKDGLKSRLDGGDSFRVSAQEFRDKNEGHSMVFDSDKVIYINSTEDDFDYILLGSSHAKHYYSYIINSGKKVASLALDGCNSTRNYSTSFNAKRCSERYSMAVEFIKTHPGKKIIWSNAWELIGDKRENHEVNYKSDFDIVKGEIKAFRDDISGTNSKVFIIGDVQGSRKIMFECLAKNELPFNKIFNTAGCSEMETFYNKPLNDAAKLAASNLTGFSYIEASDALCKNGQCKVIIDEKPVYTDYTHLSKVGSYIVGRYLFDKIDN